MYCSLVAQFLHSCKSLGDHLPITHLEQNHRYEPLARNQHHPDLFLKMKTTPILNNLFIFITQSENYYLIDVQHPQIQTWALLDRVLLIEKLWCFFKRNCLINHDIWTLEIIVHQIIKLFFLRLTDNST